MEDSGKHRSVEQIIRLLREAEVRRANGQRLEDFCREIGINPGTFSRWKRQYGGMKAGDMKRLKELQKENMRLKRLVAELELEKVILKEALEGK